MNDLENNEDTYNISLPVEKSKQKFSYEALNRIYKLIEDNLLGDDFVEGVLLFLAEEDIEPKFFIKHSDSVIIAKLKESSIKGARVRKADYQGKVSPSLLSLF